MPIEKQQKYCLAVQAPVASREIKDKKCPYRMAFSRAKLHAADCCFWLLAVAAIVAPQWATPLWK